MGDNRSQPGRWIIHQTGSGGQVIGGQVIGDESLAISEKTSMSPIFEQKNLRFLENREIFAHNFSS